MRAFVDNEDCLTTTVVIYYDDENDFRAEMPATTRTTFVPRCPENLFDSLHDGAPVLTDGLAQQRFRGKHDDGRQCCKRSRRRNRRLRCAEVAEVLVNEVAGEVAAGESAAASGAGDHQCNGKRNRRLRLPVVARLQAMLGQVRCARAMTSGRCHYSRLLSAGAGGGAWHRRRVTGRHPPLVSVVGAVAGRPSNRRLGRIVGSRWCAVIAFAQSSTTVSSGT